MDSTVYGQLVIEFIFECNRRQSTWSTHWAFWLNWNGLESLIDAYSHSYTFAHLQLNQRKANQFTKKLEMDTFFAHFKRKNEIVSIFPQFHLFEQKQFVDLVILADNKTNLNKNSCYFPWWFFSVLFPKKYKQKHLHMIRKLNYYLNC